MNRQGGFVAKKTTDKRRLIKFSNYSMCITLPKWVIDQLEWQKGDELTLVTDVKHGKITLFRDDATMPPSDNDTPPSKKESQTSNDSNDSDELQPIPKLRW